MKISLYKRLKPVFKQPLIDNLEEYPSITTDIIKSLSRNDNWSELSMGDVSSLITFTHYDFEKMTAKDWITGKTFFNEQED